MKPAHIIASIAIGLAISACASSAPATPSAQPILTAALARTPTASPTPRAAPDSARTATPTRPQTQTPLSLPTGVSEPEPEKSVNAWKTYRDGAYGFTFEYPAVYEEAAYQQLCGVKKDSSGVTIGARSQLLVLDAAGLTTEQYAGKLLSGRDWSVEARRQDTVGGLPAVTVDYRFGGQNRFGTFTVVKRDDRIFAFNFTAGGQCDIPESKVSEVAAYRHMMESFRFGE